MRLPSVDRLKWYMARASAMPPGEWIDRIRTAVRTVEDRRRPYPHLDAITAPASGWPRPAGSPVLVEDDTVARVRGLDGVVDAARAHADALVAGHYVFFGYPVVEDGANLDWNIDPISGYRFPLVHWSQLDYRRVAGDPKWVWERGRHLHLVHLARAWRLTGNPTYAQAAAEGLQSFLDQCPPGRGIHWRVGLELGLRLISWTWIAEFLRGSDVCTPELGLALMSCADAHMRWIERFPSTHSSANNHRLGELCGLAVGALAFPSLPRAEERYQHAIRELRREFAAQTHPDGGNAEAALYYHQFVLDLLMVTVAVIHRSGRPVPGTLSDALSSMANLSGTVASDAGSIPVIGDKDDAVAVDLMTGADEPARLRSRLRAVSALLGTTTARLWQGQDEQSLWLCGDLVDRVADQEKLPGSAVYPRSGYAVLRRRPQIGEVRAVLRAGPFGLGPIYAHAHADQLSLCLSVNGHEAIIDAGTFTYYGDTRWRDYARSTAAHSTLRVDGREQARPSGPFLWRETAHGSIDLFAVTDDAIRVRAHHDAYAPVRHIRTVELDDVITVHDELRGATPDTKIELRWHLAPGTTRVEDQTVTWTGPHAQLTLAVDGISGSIDVREGDSALPVGFQSLMLEHWEPSPTVIVRGTMVAEKKITTTITPGTA